MHAVLVIPSRFASTRFPGKPLAMIAGKTLIQRVCERARTSTEASAVWVATDDQRIFDHVQSLGIPVVMTGEAQSGTDRIAATLELIEKRDDQRYELVINLQGDEPLVDMQAVDSMIRALQEPGVEMVTLACPLESATEFESPDVVKVVTDLERRALYFSRHPIPHNGLEHALRHVGVYGYRRDTLLRLAATAPAPLELSERLEQLRALQNGVRIHVLHTPTPHLGVDRPEDVAKVEHELDRLHA